MKTMKILYNQICSHLKTGLILVLGIGTIAIAGNFNFQNLGLSKSQAAEPKTYHMYLWESIFKRELSSPSVKYDQKTKQCLPVKYNQGLSAGKVSNTINFLKAGYFFKEEMSGKKERYGNYFLISDPKDRIDALQNGKGYEKTDPASPVALVRDILYLHPELKVVLDYELCYGKKLTRAGSTDEQRKWYAKFGSAVLGTWAKFRGISDPSVAYGYAILGAFDPNTDKLQPKNSYYFDNGNGPINGPDALNYLYAIPEMQSFKTANFSKTDWVNDPNNDEAYALKYAYFTYYKKLSLQASKDISTGQVPSSYGQYMAQTFLNREAMGAVMSHMPVGGRAAGALGTEATSVVRRSGLLQGLTKSINFSNVFEKDVISLNSQKMFFEDFQIVSKGLMKENPEIVIEVGDIRSSIRSIFVRRLREKEFYAAYMDSSGDLTVNVPNGWNTIPSSQGILRHELIHHETDLMYMKKYHEVLSTGRPYFELATEWKTIGYSDSSKGAGFQSSLYYWINGMRLAERRGIDAKSLNERYLFAGMGYMDDADNVLRFSITTDREGLDYFFTLQDYFNDYERELSLMQRAGITNTPEYHTLRAKVVEEKTKLDNYLDHMGVK